MGESNMNTAISEAASVEKYEAIFENMIKGDNTSYKALRKALEEDDPSAGRDAMGSALFSINSRAFMSKDMEFSPRKLKTIGGIVDFVYSNRAAEVLLNAADIQANEPSTVYNTANVGDAVVSAANIFKSYKSPENRLRLMSTGIERIGKQIGASADIMNDAIKLAYRASQHYVKSA